MRNSGLTFSCYRFLIKYKILSLFWFMYRFFWFRICFMVLHVFMWLADLLPSMAWSFSWCTYAWKISLEYIMVNNCQKVSGTWQKITHQYIQNENWAQTITFLLLFFFCCYIYYCWKLFIYYQTPFISIAIYENESSEFCCLPINTIFIQSVHWRFSAILTQTT